ncbi:C-type lectin domain family 10 member A-like, partial [Ictalurus furcatus]|uniref:C-type lectin domain family 10 member A-like n=1 Tax=Ictalurus furcatus TaxID=66913 RepID=UPI0023505305
MLSASSRQYHFVNKNKSWTEAQRYCRENYTDLATVDNMEEMNTLLNTVNVSYLGLAWIGLYDDLDSWRWSLDDDSFYKEGEKMFRGWYHEPDNYNGKELCVFIRYDGEWSDGDCNNDLTFVCDDAQHSSSTGRNVTDGYIWVNRFMPWAEAQRYCRQHYKDLASVRNQAD